MEYITVMGEGEAEFVEKKSRFIGACRPVQTEEEALAFINGKKKQFWDANHNVYAYILRQGGVQRFSDDGEPQGTAGIPVLEAMKKSGVTDAVVVPPGISAASCWGAVAWCGPIPTQPPSGCRRLGKC